MTGQRSRALFDRASCDVTWTTPSMASVMTGTYETVHGFKTTYRHSLDDRNITLAEILHEHGYTTAAVVGSFSVDSIYGLDQGFDICDVVSEIELDEAAQEQLRALGYLE